MVPSGCWPCSITAGHTRGGANHERLSERTSSSPPPSRRKRIWPRRAWKSVIRLTEDTSSHRSTPGEYTSRSNTLDAAKVRSPAHNSTTRYGRARPGRDHLEVKPRGRGEGRVAGTHLADAVRQPEPLQRPLGVGDERLELGLS